MFFPQFLGKVSTSVNAYEASIPQAVQHTIGGRTSKRDPVVVLIYRSAIDRMTADQVKWWPYSEVMNEDMVRLLQLSSYRGTISMYGYIGAVSYRKGCSSV